MNKTDKIYVAGHNGMVGLAIIRKLKSEGYENLVIKNSNELDLRNQNAVNQFFERFELSIKQMLQEDMNKLIAQPGISAQLIVTCVEGNVGRYIRSKFKESPSTYIENIWELLSFRLIMCLRNIIS